MTLTQDAIEFCLGDAEHSWCYSCDQKSNRRRKLEFTREQVTYEGTTVTTFKVPVFLCEGCENDPVKMHWARWLAGEQIQWHPELARRYLKEGQVKTTV